MERKRKVMMIGGVVAIAAATGHLMQGFVRGGDGGGMARVAPASIVPLAATLPAAAVPPETASGIAGASVDPTSALPEAGSERMAALDAAPAPAAEMLAPTTSSAPPRADIPPQDDALAQAAPDAKPAPEIVAARGECTVDMALIAQPGAVIDLGLLAPCHPDARVVIRHGGLAITARTTTAGTLIGTIPAFGNPAEVSILFGDGARVAQSVAVPDIASYDRFAVQWMDGDAFQLHAYEAGAGFGDPGHVSAVSPRGASAAGSFLHVLGDSTTDHPLLAEIYTYPAGVTALGEGVRLTVEAAITDSTCGRDLLGETIQMTAGEVVVRDLTVAMEACDGAGGFVVLENPIQPRQLALR